MTEREWLRDWRWRYDQTQAPRADLWLEYEQRALAAIRAATTTRKG